MRVPTTPRRLAGAVGMTVALGALAATYGLSSSSASSLLANARRSLESAKTYDVDVSFKSSRSGPFTPVLHAEIDVPQHLTLETLHLGVLPLRMLFTPHRFYIQAPTITSSASSSAIWYALPQKGVTASIGSASSNLGQLLSSFVHPKLDGHVVVRGQTCTLITASTSLASFEKSLGTTFQTSGEQPVGGVTVDVAISPAGYPLRVVERVNAGHLHEIVMANFSNFGAPLHITVPSPSHIKKLSAAQLAYLFGALFTSAGR